MSGTVLARPGASNAARAIAAARLSSALETLLCAERYRAEVTVALHSGDTGLSRAGASDDAVTREARERVYAMRSEVDEICLELLAPEEHALTPNDEDDMATALQLRLRANEEAEVAPGELSYLEESRREYVLQVHGRRC
ncbi:hypothetical protein [Methylobacterium nodulans]|uniref:Uncharacterized protein n=1 Tax=Methylobacterium nodulans (strain LMG 21967 / CNCM I-2342 / ORS 2060) TaxID=460265 RepID=B8IIQ8_METNO|nr:hypothetical protein [Methylobacterium nodulans]ACL59935.1 hypothetical protein Mnod_5089 [Methylobacterium nodulans ORS 2060]